MQPWVIAPKDVASLSHNRNYYDRQQNLMRGPVQSGKFLERDLLKAPTPRQCLFSSVARAVPL
jgi:hypothetical protein